MMKKKLLLFECLIAISFSIQTFLPDIFTPMISLTTFVAITTLKCKYEGLRSPFLFFMMIEACLMFSSDLVIRIGAALFAYALLIYFPIYDFPDNGSFLVGYKELFLPQNLNVSVFYPTIQQTKRARYRTTGDTWRRMSDFLRSLPGNIIPEIVWRILFSFIDFLDIGANHDAQIISPKLLTNSQKFPVVIFSHGIAGNRNFYTGFPRTWASNGYIVFCIDHDEPVFITFNSVEELRDIRIPHLKERCALITRVTDFVYSLSELKEFFQSSELEIDYSRISLSGHSFGGASVAEVAHDPRITGVLVLFDPWFFPSNPKVVETPANRPVLIIRTLSFSTFCPPFRVLENIRRYVEVNKQYQDQTISCYFNNITHKSFTDMIIHMPREMEMIKTVKSFHDIEEIYNSQTQLSQYFLDEMLYSAGKKEQVIKTFESYLLKSGGKNPLQIDDF